MNIKEVNSVNEYMIKISKDLLNGKIISPRNMKTLEIEDAIMILNKPENNIVTLKSRNLNETYLNAEMQWYLSANPSPEFIEHYSSFWAKLKNKDGTVNSNYGIFVFAEDQFNWCKNRLIEDNDSRQAIINYNQVRHKYEGNKDFVCTVAQQFRINNSQLDSRVVMRSNDLIYGFCYDIPWFTFIQKQLADTLDINVGKYIHYAISLHVYERHFKMLEDIANEGNKQLQLEFK